MIVDSDSAVDSSLMCSRKWARKLMMPQQILHVRISVIDQRDVCWFVVDDWWSLRFGHLLSKTRWCRNVRRTSPMYLVDTNVMTKRKHFFCCLPIWVNSYTNLLSNRQHFSRFHQFGWSRKLFLLFSNDFSCDLVESNRGQYFAYSFPASGAVIILHLFTRIGIGKILQRFFYHDFCA